MQVVYILFNRESFYFEHECVIHIVNFSIKDNKLNTLLWVIVRKTVTGLYIER